MVICSSLAVTNFSHILGRKDGESQCREGKGMGYFCALNLSFSYLKKFAEII